MEPITDTAAVISQREIKKELKYNGIVMLKAEIAYPQVQLKNQRSQNRINTYYQNAARHFFRHAATELFANAVTDYHYRQKNDFPFNPYEAVMQDTVMLNQGCTLSTYIDQYTFTGGAHGNTQRFSETWNLRTGRRLQLEDIFGPQEPCCRTLLRFILDAADAEAKKDPGIFFEDYRVLLVQYFDPESFYLTPEGITVYYQQYEIAPYASGIPVFTIPYAALHIKPPGCV